MIMSDIYLYFIDENIAKHKEGTMGVVFIIAFMLA